VNQRRFYALPAGVILAGIVLLADLHAQELHVPVTWVALTNLLSFFWIIGQLFLAHANETMEATPRELQRFNVCVVVPVYNEDPVTFRDMLDSLLKQSIMPNTLYVVDDGSKSNDCLHAFKAWERVNACAIDAHYIWQQNSGKRTAQSKAFLRATDADIFVTLDSDTVLDAKALENGCKPFTRHKVMGVAGMLYGLNNRANLLTRLVDLGFTTSFLNGRAAWSRLHSVAVSCGGLAFYRASVVRKYMDEYLNHTVNGKLTTCGDDRMLTNFALLEGWTVFQESSVGYTLLPTNIKHLTKQRIRWWRSFFWGSEWLLRRFEMDRLVWWMVAWQMTSFVLYSILVPTVLLIHPVLNHHIPLLFFAYLFAFSYIRDVRYLSFKRPDMSYLQQLGIYLLAPISSLLHFYLCTVLQYVGLATFDHMGWSTRATVEVGMAEQSA
jgi:hyaluronan synthase